MLSLLYKILIGSFCKHDYVLERGELNLYEDKTDRPYGIIRLYKCNKCSAFKEVKIKI